MNKDCESTCKLPSISLNSVYVGTFYEKWICLYMQIGAKFKGYYVMVFQEIYEPMPNPK